MPLPPDTAAHTCGVIPASENGGSMNIGALTGPQQLAIATDLFGGVPPKFTSDAGEDSADLLVLYCLSQTGLSTADKNLVKRSAAAIYTRDNPLYLTHPSFDPTILVAGDEPVP